MYEPIQMHMPLQCVYASVCLYFLLLLAAKSMQKRMSFCLYLYASVRVRVRACEWRAAYGWVYLFVRVLVYVFYIYRSGSKHAKEDIIHWLCGFVTF